MLIGIGSDRLIPPVTVVFAYDISHPRRARRVRAILQSRSKCAQYSVFEMQVMRAEAIGLLAEVHSACDTSTDRLALWWPRADLRLDLVGKSALLHDGSQVRRTGINAAVRAIQGSGNYVLCYDITEPDARAAIAELVAYRGSALQRSVFWLRSTAPSMAAMLRASGNHLGRDDRFWVYPLARVGDLWRVEAGPQSILPMSDHGWHRR